MAAPKGLRGDENSPYQSNLLGTDLARCSVVMTQRYQPTTTGTEAIQTESSNHEQIDGMVLAPGGVGWMRCKFLWVTQKKLMLLAMAGSRLGDWLVWGQFFDPNVNQDTIGKLWSRAFD
jgi:hypothetical protein